VYFSRKEIFAGAGVFDQKKWLGADSEKGLRHLARVGNIALKRSAAARRDS